jgi:hypothetical protein
VRCILESRLSPALLFESGKVGVVPSQVSIEVPKVPLHCRQPRLDAIESSIIQEDSNQNQYGWNRDAECELEIRHTYSFA